jgi:hypothetical protein
LGHQLWEGSDKHTCSMMSCLFCMNKQFLRQSLCYNIDINGRYNPDSKSRTCSNTAHLCICKCIKLSCH